MRAAAYPRYSSDNQREESIDAQLRAIQDYAQRNGISIVKIYPEEARSTTTDNRPQFQQMMADSAKGMFDCVIVHKLDRFARDRYDSAFYKRELKRNGVKLISVLENIDGSPESIMLESILEGMAEYYSKNLAREVMKGMRETAYQCKHTGGLPPLGYDVDSDKKYIINPLEAEAVRIIFEMYGSGQGYNLIIDTLNEKGYKTKKGQEFSKNGLHNILKNEKYYGTYVFNRAVSKVGGKRNNSKSKDESEIIRVPGGMPAIITPEQWQRVCEKMETNKKNQASYTARAVYLLSGKIYCGSCDGAMVGKHFKGGRNKTDYGYYECANRKRVRNCSMKPINQEFIEKIVIDIIYENIVSKNAIPVAAELVYNYSRSQKKDIPAYISKIKKELSKIEKEIKNIVDAIAGGMFHSSMKNKLDDLESEKNILVIRLEEANRQCEMHSFTKEDISKYLSDFTNIKDMTPDEQKKAVEVFVRRVTVFDDYFDIDISPFQISPLDSPDDDGQGANGEGGKTPVKNDENSTQNKAHTEGNEALPCNEAQCNSIKTNGINRWFLRHDTARLASTNVSQIVSLYSETFRVSIENYRHRS